MISDDAGKVFVSDKILREISDGRYNKCIPVIDDSVHFEKVCAIVEEEDWDNHMFIFNVMARELLAARKCIKEMKGIACPKMDNGICLMMNFKEAKEALENYDRVVEGEW